MYRNWHIKCKAIRKELLVRIAYLLHGTFFHSKSYGR